MGGKIEVESKVRVYEVDGGALPRGGEDIKLRVRSHAILGDQVVLVTPDGESYTVIAGDLICAIKNAQNSGF